MNDTSVNREWTERFYAERGLTLSDGEWTAIKRTVDAAPHWPSEQIRDIAALFRPIPAPPAGTPSTRTRPDTRPRSRRAERAA
ncbi:hypothetical protein [Amycolatopsis sp. CA-230715]|uniref:hypothetical protein n=1 Tax=Amycolatopsis sp. CA-230715 TaxID=2745196 RepID=UPI001C023551|nr:hypothetical protein [Amycolatopsis sp. CA-230715]QWF78747.1 hypothetical protein HUW46_02145 [Amycolatopsis sp. CA-230715]